MEFKTYSRRTGSDDLGKDYEYKITALLALRCATLPDTENVWVGSNVDHVGDFDDIGICRKTTNGEHYAYLIQLKHQQNPKPIAKSEFMHNSDKKKKDNFSLSKYHNSFLDIQNKIQSNDGSSEIINYLKKCDKIVPILFTNKFTPTDDLLEPKLDDSLNFLKTTTTHSSTFTFNSKKFNFNSDFLDHLVLFTNQAHVNDVDKLVEDEVKILTGSDADSKSISQKFLKFILMWSKEKNNNVYYTLTKNDIINKLVSFALERYALGFSKDRFVSSDCERIQVFNKIIETGSKFLFDFDDFVFNFLKSYLATEIKKHVNVDNMRRWSDHLSNEQQGLFLAKYLNSNTKTLEVGEKLGIFDVYQNLWLSNKVPLILSIIDNQNYDNIQKILELSQCNLSFIILKDNNLKLSEKEVTSSLADLKPAVREQILYENIKLQGRAPICLKLLISESLQEFLKLRDIVYILSGTYNIGSHCESLPDHFIAQKLSMVCIKHEVIANLVDDLFLIENHTNFLVDEHSNTITSAEGDDLKPFQLSEKDTHRLEYFNDFYFVWKNTFGNIKSIRQYRDESVTSFMFEEYSIAQLFPKSAWENYDIKFRNIYNPVHIVSADPGMGKSVFMNFIASQTSTDFWVLKLNLIEFEHHFFDLFKLGVEDQLAFLNLKLLERGDCINPEIAQKIFESFLMKKQVLVLLDGFDEIAFMFKNEITSMAQKFHKAGYFIWITTRPVMKTHLEDSFNTFSVTIKPFTSKDQESYLIQYFSSVLDPGNNLNFLIEFVQELLSAARRNFNDEDYKFTGVPLQTRFMGEVFSKEYIASLTSGLIDFNQTFDLLYLYEEFSKGKIDILCQKYDNNAKRSRILFKKYQQLYAIYLVFPELFTKTLNLTNILKDYCVNKTEEIQFLQREGVLVLDQYSVDSKYKFNVKFVHLTFAEFLAAQWLSENINSADEAIRISLKELMEWRFRTAAFSKFLFKMFDRILAKNCPLHLAIINNRLDKIDLGYANDLDRGGRSALHLIALYGVTHKNSMEPVVDQLVPLVDDVNENVEVRDKVLSYNALDYSIRNASLAVANKLCERFQLTTSVDVSRYDAIDYFSYCVTLNYRQLFHMLLNYLASRSILLQERDKNDSLQSFCRVRFDHPNVQEYLSEYGEKATIGDLFKIPDQNHYNDFRFAISFGEIENINHLLPYQSDLNDVDVDNNTPLYYAVTFQRLDHVKLLLSKGVEINKPGKNGDSALHVAVKKGNVEIFNELLQNHANINCLNNLKRTPIFLSVLHRHCEIVAKLEEEGAILNLEDTEGNNVLHFAAISGYVEFIKKYLIKYPISVNKPNKNGDTPLLLATKNRNSECVNVLLSNGAACNKENVAGNTPLHYASQEGFYQLTQELISHNCDVNKQNKKQENPLLVAMKCRQRELAELLLTNGADCNMGDVDGYVPFHEAIQEGWAEFVIEMIFFGADINKCGRNKATPLHLATDRGYPAIAKILIDCGAEVHSRDIFGSTALHYAAQGGQNEIIDELLQRGADINSSNKFKHTPLQSALRFHKSKTANFLLDANADWNTIDICANTSLMVASESGLTYFVSYFISQGISVNLANNYGQTALHMACLDGRLDAVQELINNSADVNSKTKDGKTPLQLCIENKIFSNKKLYEDYISIITLLLENRADVNLQNNYGNSALHYVCFSRHKHHPLPNHTVEFVVEHFYEPVAILLLENNVNTNLKNVEKKTALDLAKEGNFTSLFKVIQDYEDIPEDAEDPDNEIKFLRRTGCESLGKEYEIKMTAILAIKCAILQNTENMWIGGNVGLVGDFDDIVLCRKTSDGKYIAYLIQLKHQENPEKLTKQDFTYATGKDKTKTKKYKKDFSLLKYYNSYLSIKKDIESNDDSSDIINFLRKCETFYLVLFTNKNAGNCSILEKSTDDSLKFLDTEDNQNIFKFNQALLNYDPNYLKHLILLSNQAHLKGTNSLIESELKNFRPFSKISNVKTIGQEFISFIRSKIEHVPEENVPEKNVKNLYTLNKSDVINKLVALALQPFMVEFFDDDYGSYDCPKKGIWNEILQNQTVTMVDLDDFIIKFLKKYIGTLVHKYVQDQKTWNDFVILDKKFNTHMLTAKEEITLFDVYCCLWFTGDVPLLLQIKSSADYQTIMNLLQLTDDLKVIMVKPEIVNVPKNGKVFFFLPDLDPSIILDQPVRLQGRSIALKDIITNAEHKHIKCRDIIYILCDCYEIGYQYEVPGNYLEQGLSKILLDYSVLTKVSDEEFIITNLIGEGTQSSNKKSEKTSHSIQVFDEFSFEWQKSTGGIDQIYQYKLDILHGNVWHPYDFSNPVNIISANSGMGKTEFLNYIATQTNTNTWILKINVKDYEDYYSDSNGESAINHIHFFNEAITQTSNCTNKTLSQLIFRKFLNKKKILILLDGFDEISIYFKDEVTNLVKCFHDEGYSICITTRPMMKNHLEKTFRTFGNPLQPLTRKNQENYLIRHFNSLIGNSKNTELSRTFAKEVLMNYARFPKFTENPLFLKFVGDASTETFKNFLLNGYSDIQINYSVFEKFKDRMTDILRQKFGEDYLRIEVMLRKYQKLCALKMVFPDKLLKRLNINQTLADYFENKQEECGLLQSEGIVTLNLCTLEEGEKFKIGFVHSIFADFLAAQWLFENFDSDNQVNRSVAQNLYETRFTNFNTSLFSILDGLLSKSCKLQTNILSDKITDTYEDVQNLDLGGRSVLHLLALCNPKFPFYSKSLSSLESSVLENIGKWAQKIDKDKFNFSPLDYALKNCKFALADYFCQHFKFSLGIPISQNLKQFYFSCCIALGLQNLFEKLLKCTAAKALLIEDFSVSVTIESFCDISSQNSNGFLEKLKGQTLLDLFKREYQDFFDLRFAVSFGEIDNVKDFLPEYGDLNESDEFNNTLLYYATKFNRLEIVYLLLLMDVNVNLSCENGNSALHLAAKLDCFDIAVALLESGANAEINNDLNQTPIFLAVKYKNLRLMNLLSQTNSSLSGSDVDGNTLLHYSAESNWIEFMTEFILCNPKFVNKKNENQQTPLVVALENGHLEFAKLLLKGGACVYSQDANGNTALHVATRNGQNDILAALTSGSGEIDMQNKNGETPLLLAGINGHAETAKLLISLGANCQIADKFGEDFIRCAIKRGWDVCVKNLLLQNNFGLFTSTLLQTAILHRRVELANELLESSDHFYAADGFGNTCLHYAAQSSGTLILEKIISKGMDLNVVNNFKRTAMHYASINNQEEAIRLLLSNGASWIEMDIYGKTPCDYAFELKFENIMNLFEDYDISTLSNKIQNVNGAVTFKLLMEPMIQHCKSKKAKPITNDNFEESLSLNKENLIAAIFHEHLKICLNVNH